MAFVSPAHGHLSGESRRSSRHFAIEPPTSVHVTRREDAWRDAAFIALLNAYRSTGGLLRGEDLAGLLVARGSGDHASLMRSIVSAEILGFDWHQTVWVPAFQLDRESFRARAEARRVLAELPGSFDGWLAAHWYVAPNARLRECRPVDLLAVDLDAVLDAARAECFIAND
jgi:hypothetical protein